jgi:hypothetical protein
VRFGENEADLTIRVDLEPSLSRSRCVSSSSINTKKFHAESWRESEEGWKSTDK